MKRFSPLALGVVAVMAVGAGSGIAYAASSGITSTTSDALIRTTSNTNMSATPGVQTTIEALTLPAGKWVVHADNTMVNFGALDIDRCTIFSGSNLLDAHATNIGNTASEVGSASETGTVVLAAATKVSVQCEHDTANGSSSYVDADAVLWAHRATSIVSMTTP